MKNFLAAMKARWRGKAEELNANIEQSFDEKRHALWEALTEAEGILDSSSYWCSIEDVYEDRVIYRIGGHDRQLYQRPYSMGESGKPTLGERSSVVREIRYLPMLEMAGNAKVTVDGVPPKAEPPAVSPPAAALPAPTTNATKDCDCPHTTEQHDNQEVQMDKKELISNVLKAQGLAESERAKFEALPEAVLKKLATTAEAPPTPALAPQQPQPAVSANPPVQQGGLSADAIYLQNRQNDQASQHRASLAAYIVANSTLKAEQSTAMDLGTLENLAGSFAAQANYGGRVFPQLSVNDDQNAVPEAPSVLLPASPIQEAAH